MARRRRSRTTSDPILRRAIMLAQQQYGPQANSILSAIKDAGAQRVSTVRQARAMGRYSTDAETAGAKALDAKLAQIGAAAQQNSGYVDTLMAAPNASSATGPGAALIAAIGTSRANIPTNVATQRATAQSQSNERATRARAGAQFAEQAANVAFQGTTAKLRDQLAGIQNQQGLKVSTTYEDLLDAANRDALDQQKFAETQRHNRAQERNAAAKGRSGGKGRRLTRGQQNAEVSKVEAAYALIQDLVDSGYSGKQIHRLLKHGGKGPREIIYDPITGKEQKDTNGNVKTNEGAQVAAYGDLARVAMDLYYNTKVPGHNQGTLTATGRRVLRRRGIKAPKSWLSVKKKPIVGPFQG